MDRRSVLKGQGATTGLALTGNALELKTLPSNTNSQATTSAGAAPASVRLVETPTAALRISERTVSELIRIRKKYADLLFYGRFNDTMGATVRSGANIRYSVFQPMQPNGNGRACVVVNFGDTPDLAEIDIDGVSGEVILATPFHPDRKAVLPVRVSIPPHQLAVVMKP